MALQTHRTAFEQLRPLVMLRPALLLAAALLAGTTACADDGLRTDYLYDRAAGAAGAFYRPLPSTTAPYRAPGSAGRSGAPRTPGLNDGGSSGVLSPAYPPGSAGAAGESGSFGSGGRSSSDLDFGSSDSAGSSGSAGTFGY